MCQRFILLLQLLSKLNIAITEEESEELIRALDLDGDGEIDFEGKGQNYQCGIDLPQTSTLLVT